MLTHDTVYIATSQERLFRETRDHLKHLSFQSCVRFASGRAMLEFATYNPVRVIIADSSLEDMSLPELLAALRTMHRPEFLHILVISQERTEDFVLGVISSGCSGLILRPYQLPALEKHMIQAEQLSSVHDSDMEAVSQAEDMITQGRYEEAIGDLSMLVSQDDTLANEFFFRGCQCLVEKKWSDAIQAFNQSLKRNQTFIKAYEGLAKAYQGKKDTDRYRLYLQKAAEEYARIDNFAKVKKIFVEIVKYDVNAPNPYNTLGIRLRQEKQYKEAIQAYLQAIALSPEDENIYYNMAKAYYCDSNLTMAKSNCVQALKLAPDHEEARKMLRILDEITSRSARAQGA